MSAELNIPEIVLASKSPRRSMLLRQVGIPFVVIIPETDEEFPNQDNFDQVVVGNAEVKAASVIDQAEGRAIIGADTIVNLNGKPLGKPKNRDDAAMTIRSLSGVTHIVHSGVVLLDPTNDRIYRTAAQTSVRFRELTEREIEAYVESGEPFDKAGSYGIQARGALFIDHIDGCFFNVMGLPLSRLWKMLMRWQEETGHISS